MNLQFKKLLFVAALVGLPNLERATAAEFNPLIANPFVFCSAPRPCKLCQPFRRIYSEICDTQSQARNSVEASSAATAQELEAQNKSLTAEQLRESRKVGASALAAALQVGNVQALDENTADLNFNSFAAGWNAELIKRRTQPDRR